MSTQFYLNSASIDKDFFDNYIKDHVQKNLHNRFDKIFENNDFIEGYSVGVKSNRVACYSELWLLDIDIKEKGTLLPIFIEDINTSSYYSLARCNMVDDNESINEYYYKSLEELVNMCPKSCRSQLKKILEKTVDKDLEQALDQE